MSATMEIDIHETLISFLRQYVSDPAGRGLSTWIIAAFPEIEYTKPAISVMEVAQTYRRERGHGYDGTIEGYRYQIDIFTSRRTVVEVLTKSYSGAHLMAYLSSQVKHALEQYGRTYFNTNLSNFVDLKMILSNTRPYNEGAEEFQKTIGVIIEVERPKI